MKREFTLEEWRGVRSAGVRAAVIVAEGTREPRMRERDDEARDALVRATAALVRQREGSGRLRRLGERAWEIRPH
jgi:hypothetical protein